MRHAGTTSPAGRGYSDAFGDWLLSNHLNLPAPARAKLLVLMGNLAEIEQWRLTLTPTERLRMNHPGAVLKNYRRATSIKPPLERGRPYGINQKTFSNGGPWLPILPTGPRQARSTVLSGRKRRLSRFRRTLWPLDDCLYGVQPRSHIGTLVIASRLQRIGIQSPRRTFEGVKPAKKKFKSYPIGFFHIRHRRGADPNRESSTCSWLSTSTVQVCLRRAARKRHHRRIKGVSAAPDRSRSLQDPYRAYR